MKPRKGPMGFDEHAVKPYAHFDRRVSYAQVKKLVEDPAYVAHHAFLPLISKTITKVKYDGEKVKVKPREVAYASHLDRCIYQRYSHLLNQRYNKTAEACRIDHVAVAYRNNLQKSNIDFAYAAFAKVVELGECWVMVADFENFFPSIDHAILKLRLRSLLGGAIPDDFFAVYKSVVRYSQWSLDDLMGFHKLDSNKRKDVAAFNRKALAISREGFRENVKVKVKLPWKGKGCGIPQGLPISGVFANIYMLEFDETMARYTDSVGGLFMRYSDDIILIMPTEKAFESGLSHLGILCNKHKLRMEPSKTLQYAVRNGKVALRNDNGGATKLQYLGFDFDGSNVRLRQRTVGRYYSRMHRAAKRVFSDPVRPSRKRVSEYYRKFSHKGIREGNGNFITYSKRAEKRFRHGPVGNAIGRDVSDHYLKMRRVSQVIAKRKNSS